MYFLWKSFLLTGPDFNPGKQYSSLSWWWAISPWQVGPFIANTSSKVTRNTMAHLPIRPAIRSTALWPIMAPWPPPHRLKAQGLIFTSSSHRFSALIRTQSDPVISLPTPAVPLLLFNPRFNKYFIKCNMLFEVVTGLRTLGMLGLPKQIPNII